MDKCNCWHEVEPYPYNSTINGVCYGTKEMEYCTCNGDTSKCDFYPEKRKEDKTMKTLEMMEKANMSDKTFCNEDNNIIYRRTVGFIDASDCTQTNMFDFDCSLNDFMAFDWQEATTITRAEAEEKYGIKIIG